jgi:hypothetical protein
MTTTNPRPQPTDRAARRRALKRRATAASLGALLAVFGAVAVTDLSQERELTAPAPVAAQPAPTVTSAVPSSTTGVPVAARQPMRVRTRQS